MEPGFPTNPADFNADDRISFSKLDNKFIAVHDDGTEFEFDADLKQWLPIDQEPLEADDFDRRTPSFETDQDSQKKRKHQAADNESQVNQPLP